MALGIRYVSVHLLRTVGLLLFGITLVFFVIHFGPAAPADQTALEAGFENEAELAQQKQAFGLTDPIWRQYIAYVVDMLTLDFGETWAERQVDITESQSANDIGDIISNRLQRTGWLWLWTFVIGVGLTAVGTFALRRRRSASVAMGAGLAGALPAFLLAKVVKSGFGNLDRVLFGLDWEDFLVATPVIARPIPVEELGTISGILLASKLAIPPALALAVPLASAATYLCHRGYLASSSSGVADAARAKGLHPGLVNLKHVLPISLLPLVSVLDGIAIVAISGTVLVESVFHLEGLGSLLYTSVIRNDYTTLQATLFVFLTIVAACVLCKNLIVGYLCGPPEPRLRDRMNRLVEHTGRRPRRADYVRERMRPTGIDRGVMSNMRTAPVSFVVWVLGACLLISLEFGALLDFIQSVVPVLGETNSFPTLINRDIIPNSGHRTPNGGWTGTFLGLSPGQAWGLRMALVYAYAAACACWLWIGYRIYRDEYRPASQTRVDIAMSKFRRHRGGMFGAFVLFVLLVPAVFAPVVATTPLDQTYAHTSLEGTAPEIDGDATVTYLDPETETVKMTTVRTVNIGSASNQQSSVGPMSYDDYGRFHPLGTSSKGTDLLSELLYGVRVYLLVAGGGALLASFLALVFVTLSSYRFGRFSWTVDALAAALGILPVLPFVLVISTLYYPRLRSLRIQLGVWGILFVILGSGRLWKTVKPLVGDSSDRRHIDHAIGFSRRQRQARAVRRNIDRVLPVMFVYSVTSASGFVVVIAATSYLGHLAPSAPHAVYEWGSFIWFGKNTLLSQSSHLFLVPSLLLVTFVAGLHWFAAGLRNALDVERQLGISSFGELTGSGEG